MNTPNLISFATFCPVTVEEICPWCPISSLCWWHPTVCMLKVSDAVDLLEALRRIEMCIAKIQAWMVMFMLKLNDDKTELVIIAPPYFLQRNKVPLPSVRVGDSGVITSKCARNIGVMIYHHMDMTTQGTRMCQAAWLQLRNIRSVRSSLTKEATLRLVFFLVMPRLDYGYISLYGISEGLLDKLQKAQNAAARLVVKCWRSDHITPHLLDLHWLPVRSSIKYKILVTTYRALHNEAPAYISEMLTPYTPPRKLIFLIEPIADAYFLTV